MRDKRASPAHPSSTYARIILPFGIAGIDPDASLPAIIRQPILTTVRILLISVMT
jgi:hypothetical protein